MTRFIDVLDLLPAVDASAAGGLVAVELFDASVSYDLGQGAIPARGAVAESSAIIRLVEPTEVGTDGIEFPFSWAPVAGSERLELDPLTLEVSAADDDFVGFPLGLVPVAQEAGGLRISAPGAPPLRGLTFDSLHEAIDGAPRLVPDDFTRDSRRHLIVRRRDPASGGWGAPELAVPPLPASGAVPRRLVGASMPATTLRLPDLAGPLLVQLATGDSPESFEIATLALTDVRAWAAPTAKDLRVLGPGGAVLWSFPGDFTSTATMRGDLTVGVAAAMEKLRAGGGPIAGALRIVSGRRARIRLRLADVDGAIVRTLPGTTAVSLEGEPAVVDVPGPPLDAAGPSSATAGLTITYLGERVADISDRLPEQDAVSGVVVQAEPVVRDLPPEALTAAIVTRIGVVGFAAVPTAVTIGLAARADPSRTIGTSAVIRPAPSSLWDVLWVRLPEPVTVTEPVVVNVSASEGRFHWAAAPDPLVRIVVQDPDPAGRLVVFGPEGGQLSTLASLTGQALRLPRAALPPEAFRGGRLAVASALLCTVELTDVELRYRRSGG